ncbi:MAG: LCP family protein [Clostridia bacterium]|nr:LCP family protein [Clostridia bacterium]
MAKRQNDSAAKQRPSSGNKKPKRPRFFTRHVGLKYFLITFGCCMAVCAVFAGVVLYMMHSQASSSSSGASTASVQTISSAAQVSASSTVPAVNAGSFNMLVVNYDDSTAVASSPTSGQPAAITLFRLDEANSRMAVMSVPIELTVSYNSVQSTLGSVYASGGISALASAFSQKTSIHLDYTCGVPFSKLSKIMDDLGGLNYSVPYSISYVTNDQRVLSVEKGSQHLNGNAVETLLGSTSYSGGTLQKYDLQTDFIKAFVKDRLSGVYISNAQAFYGDVLSNVQTAFQVSDLSSRAGLIKSIEAKGGNYIATVKPQYTPTVQGTVSVYDYGSDATALFSKYFNVQ